MKRRTLWVNLGIGAVIVVIIGLIFAVLRPAPAPEEQRTVSVTRGTVSATVTASGTVERAGVVDLAFISGGTITAVNVEPGDAVSVGTVLAAVDDTTALQQLASAESTLAQAVQSTASTDASIASASAALADAKRVARETNRRNRLAVKQARESLRAAENLWNPSCLELTNPNCPNPAAQAQLRAAQATIDSAQLAATSATETAANNAIGYEIAINQASATLAQRQAQQSSSCSDDSTSTVCENAKASTLAAQQALENAQRAKVTGLIADRQAQQSAAASLASANIALQQLQGELAKAGSDAVRSARQTLDTSERTLEQGKVTGEQSVRTAQSSLNSALAAERSVAVSSGDDTNAGEAAIAAAQTGVEVALQALDDTQLVSPVAGIVGTVPYVVGEAAVSTGTQGGITVLPDGPLEIVADFAESDAAGIDVGAPATVTFDALAGEQAEGSVIAVDPVATTSASGLITYSVRVQVTDPPEDRKSVV